MAEKPRPETTIRVAKHTRDELARLAEHKDESFDSIIRRLIASYRRSRG